MLAGYFFLLGTCYNFQEWLERFSIECRKTKTKAITGANHSTRKEHNEPMNEKSIQIHVTGAMAKRAKAKTILDYMYFQHSTESCMQQIIGRRHTFYIELLIYCHYF